MKIRRAKPQTGEAAMAENALLRAQNQDLRTILEDYDDIIGFVADLARAASAGSLARYRERRGETLKTIDLTQQRNRAERRAWRAELEARHAQS